MHLRVLQVQQLPRSRGSLLRRVAGNLLVEIFQVGKRVYEFDRHYCGPWRFHDLVGLIKLI